MKDQLFAFTSSLKDAGCAATRKPVNWLGGIHKKSGLEFERVCMENVDQIKMKLGISGVFTDMILAEHIY